MGRKEEYKEKNLQYLQVLSTQEGICPLPCNMFYKVLQTGTGTAVKMLQVFLQVQTDGIFGTETENALRTFQKNTNQSADGICGKNSWTAIAVHMRENTYAGY